MNTTKNKQSTIWLCVITMLFLALGTFGTSITAKAATATINIKQTKAHATSITYEWDKVDNAVSYSTYYIDAASYSENLPIGKWKTNSSYATNGDADDTSASLIGLSSTSRYYVRVYAHSSKNNQIIAQSDLLVVTTPGKVENVVQTDATSDSVTLSWTAVEGADGYYVYAGNGTDSEPVATSTTNSAIVTGLSEADYTGSTAPKYTVAAFCKGAGEFSATGYSSTSGYVYIAPAKIKEFALHSWLSKNNKATVKWKYSGYADGYELEILNTKNEVIKTYKYDTWKTGQQILKISSIKDTGFIAKIHGYKTINGKEYYGDSSTITCVPDAKITKLKALKNGQASIKWKKVKGASNYTIYAIMDVGKNKVVKKKVAKISGKKTSYTVKNLKKYKDSYKYNTYFYVQANGVKINGKKYNSQYDYKQYKTFKKVKLKN